MPIPIKIISGLLLLIGLQSSILFNPNPPQVILKLDDLKFEDGLVHPGWIQVVDFLNEENVQGTIGLIGNSLEKADAKYFNWIKQRDKEGYEIWNHGYCHCRWEEEGVKIKEFRGTTLEAQTKSLVQTQKLAQDKLGLKLLSFGAPYNSTDANTAKALEAIPELKVWMFKETKDETQKLILPRINEVNIEYPVHQPDFKKLKAGYKKFKDEPVLVIQGHPRSWVEDPARFADFKKIVKFLKKKGVTFTTPEAILLRHSKELATDQKTETYSPSMLPLYQRDNLIYAKQQFQQKKAPFWELVNTLKIAADEALLIEPPSVIQKTLLPASNNKHDYYSIGPYWWPNPDTEDGLPYVRHDGKVNPESKNYDRPALGKMVTAVFNLSLAYFYTDQEDYALKAEELLRVWFVNPETKMNPHLEYGQAIPGITEGRGIGLIETGSFLKIISAVGFLKDSKSFSDATYQELRAWFKDFNYWTLTSEKGWDERRWHNNHGSSYDSQVVTYSLFTGEDSIATLILDSVIIKRINRQIEPDGRQPWELERTKSMSYSIKNLDHLIENAILAGHYGKDLWNYESPDGRSIKNAIRYLIPYMLGEGEWTYTQYGGIQSKMKAFKELIWVANLYLEDELIQRTFQTLFKDGENPLAIQLLYPYKKN